MTNDQALDTAVRALLREPAATRTGGLHRALARVGTIPQRHRRWWPFSVTVTGAQRWGSTLSSALKFVAAAVIVALFGGFLLAGVLTTQQGDEVVPAAVIGSPSPSAVRSDILPSVSLTVEEVEPGVYRVIDDAVRDLAPVEAVDITAGYDGGIRLLRKDEFLRLGTDGSHEWPDVPFANPDDPHAHPILEVAPDGTMWVIPRWDQILDPRRAPGLRSTDGEAWTVEPCPGGRQYPDCRGFSVAPDGRVWVSWDEDGRWRLGHLGPAGWQPLDGYLPIYFRRLFFTDTGDIYGMRDGEDRLYRYDEGGSSKYGPGRSTPWERVAGSMFGPFVLGVGRDGTVWLRNDDALARLADGEWEPVNSTDLLDPGSGLGLDHEFKVAPDGSLWSSLWRKRTVEDRPGPCDGLARFDGATFAHFLPGQCISMDIASDGSVWVLAGDETVWVEDGQWILADDQTRDLYVITPEVAAEAAEAIDTTVPTTITSDILSGVTLTVEEVELGVFRVVNDGVRDVERVTMTAVGDDGTVWVDLAKGVVELGRPGEHPGLVDGEGFLAFAEDGTLWAASGDAPEDLRSYDGATWTVRGTVPDGTASVPDPWWPADYITDFAVHPDGTVWQVAEQNGHDAHTRVQHLGTDTWTTHDVRADVAALGWCGVCADGEPCPAVACEGGWETLEITPDGTVWVGVPPRDPPAPGSTGGLLRFDGSDWEAIRPLGGAEDHGVVGLLADRDGALWAEFETGELARFDGTAWEVVRPLGADEDRRVGLLADRDGVLWVRTGSGHLARFDGKAWQSFSTDRDPEGTHAVDPDGNLWVGSPYDWDIASQKCEGVRRFDGPTWTTFLPGMCIADIDIAGDGSVWVRTDDDAWAWIPGYGHGGGLYVITPEAVAASE